MFHLVTGGSGSGKSAFAEQKILDLGPARRIYIATMYPGKDPENAARIARHRTMRKQKSFETVECYTALADLDLPEGSNVLLECMSNLAANEMFLPGGAGVHTASAAVDGVRHLLKHCGNLVVVTNEIFSDGGTYDALTVQYLEALGTINRKMAEMADFVTEVVYGIPLTRKAPADCLPEAGVQNLVPEGAGK
jgi:adenosylcobinamide kinase/adenosylcobinamide-phosphate guanylyltransferase